MSQQVEYYSMKLEFETDPSDLYEMVKRDEKIRIIDARAREFYDIEHIPNAMNIPHRQMNNELTKELDPSFLYVTYCDGIGCNASTKAALKLAGLGLNVKELLGGLDWWKRDGYATIGTNTDEATFQGCGC